MDKEPPHLFDPARINVLTLKNRLVRSATWEGMSTEAGCPTPKLIDLYRELARGGVGLIISGFAFVTADGKPLPGAMGLHREDFAAEFSTLTGAVHEEGGRICAQLGHAGGQTRQALIGGQPLAPSPVPAPQYGHEQPLGMMPDDIERISQAFAAAAGRARAYGFDAVQVLAAHGYLFNQFLSPHTNSRTDAYGGTLENRSRFLLETIRRVRETVGKDFPILVKLNGSDNIAGGLSLEEAARVAEAISASGVDAIEVTSGTPASGKFGPLRTGIDTPEAESYNLFLAKAIKQAARCPVITVGGMRSYWTAKAIIRRGDSDFISLSRPLIREPDLPRRWYEQTDSPLSRCISCNACYRAALKGHLHCAAARKV